VRGRTQSPPPPGVPPLGNATLQASLPSYLLVRLLLPLADALPDAFAAAAVEYQRALTGPGSRYREPPPRGFSMPTLLLQGGASVALGSTGISAQGCRSHAAIQSPARRLLELGFCIRSLTFVS